MARPKEFDEHEVIAKALELFQRARPLIVAGTNPQKQQVLDGIDQYIANQEAIIRAGSR